MATAVTELIGIMERQTDLVSQLVNNSSSSLQSKNIIGSPNSTFSNESANLNSSEKRKITQIGEIFAKKMIEEERKNRKDTAEKTKIAAKVSKPGVKEKTQKVESKKGGSLLDTILGLLGLGALLDKDAIKKFVLKKLLPKLVEFGKTLFKGLGKLLGIVKKFILEDAWPMIKKAFSKIWRFIKKFGGKLWGGLKGLAQKIWDSDFIKGIRTFVGDAIAKIKTVFDDIAGGIKGFFSNIFDRVKGLWDDIISSPMVTALKDTLDNVVKSISEFFGGLKKKIVDIISSIMDGIKNLIPEGLRNKIPGLKSADEAAGAIKGATQGAAQGASKGFFGKIVGGAKSLGSSVISGAKAVGGSVASGAKAVGGAALSGAKAIGGMPLKLAQDTVEGGAKMLLKSTGGMFGFLTKVAGKGLSKVPIIGPAIEAAFAAFDIKSMKEKMDKGEITEEQLQKMAGKRVIEAVGDLLGSGAGTLLGGLLGTFIPIPGIGTAIGTIAGSMVGGMAGKWLGGLVSDYIVPEKYTRSIGAFLTGTTPPKEEMQDFIIKDGQVHRFNKRDEVLGMKQGGAIQEFMSNPDSKHLRAIININIQMAQFLQTIANNTSIMASNSKGGGSRSGSSQSIPSIGSSGSSSGPKQMATLNNNRGGYHNSVYALG